MSLYDKTWVIGTTTSLGDMNQKETVSGMTIHNVRPATMTLREMVKITLTLLCFYVVIGGLITITYIFTIPVIARNAELKQKAAQETSAMMPVVQKGLPDAKTIDKAGDWNIHEQVAPYYSISDGTSTIGYAILSYGKGYQSLIQCLVVIGNDMKIKNVAVISQAETPGLGDRILEADFLKQFENRDIAMLSVTTSGDAESVQAITAATISSKALTEDAIKNAALFIKGLK
ncbi:MAG: FMN-binding protein [Fibrobacterota bacterium]|nr:FMN-binding protein [Chitinispirillaceae bacterium]